MRSAFGLLIAIVLLAGVMLAQTKAAPSAGKKVYVANCAMCHGPDGKGTSTGKSMGVKDLQSAEAKKMTDAQVRQVIANGKNTMPAWKGQLSDEQIAQVTAFVRTLQKSAAK